MRTADFLFFVDAHMVARVQEIAAFRRQLRKFETGAFPTVRKTGPFSSFPCPCCVAVIFVPSLSWQNDHYS
jgi:hypothetical protein